MGRIVRVMDEKFRGRWRERDEEVFLEGERIFLVRERERFVWRNGPYIYRH